MSRNKEMTNEEAIELINSHCYFNSLVPGVKEALDKATEALGHTSPCDLCQYNPPSSGDGKPCSMCPACSGGNE